jgi:AcrR family transcriptional regulator
MSREKLRTELRKEQIAQAAIELVAQRGLSGFSVASLADRVGLVPSAIYRHFRSKDEVLDAALDLIQQKLVANTRAVCDETSDASERLRRLLMRHVQMFRENQAVPRIIFAEEPYAGRSERKAITARIIRSYLDRVAEIVRQGQRDGDLRKDLNPATVSIMFLGLVQPAGVLWFVTDGRFDVARHLRSAWEVFHDAIRAD